MNSATWTCPRCGAVHSIYSMTCNCPAPSVATDSTDYVFDLRPMKSERMVLVSADHIARMEARLREWDEFIARCHSIIGEEPGAAHTLDQRIAALKAERDEALKAARIPSHFKHGLAAWINLLTASSEEADDALGDFGAEVAGLQAQVAALTKERDEAKESARRSAAEVLAVMGAFAGCQRDDEVPHETAMRVVDERADYLDRLGNMIDCYDAARQSRARLVRLVRHMKAVRHTVIDLVCDTLHIWRPADDTRSELLRHERYALKAITTLRGELREAVDQRDAARAWAAMWKRRAKAHRDNAKHLDHEADALYKSCNAARAWAAAWKRAAIKWRAIYTCDHQEPAEDYQQSDELILAQTMYLRAIHGTAQERRDAARRAAESMERQ